MRPPKGAAGPVGRTDALFGHSSEKLNSRLRDSEVSPGAFWSPQACEINRTDQFHLSATVMKGGGDDPRQPLRTEPLRSGIKLRHSQKKRTHMRMAREFPGRED